MAVGTNVFFYCWLEPLWTQHEEASSGQLFARQLMNSFDMRSEGGRERFL